MIAVAVVSRRAIVARRRHRHGGLVAHLDLVSGCREHVPLGAKARVPLAGGLTRGVVARGPRLSSACVSVLDGSVPAASGAAPAAADRRLRMVTMSRSYIPGWPNTVMRSPVSMWHAKLRDQK